MREYDLNAQQAQALLWRINGLATLVLRRFIEHELSGGEPQPANLRQGLLALVGGPTYYGLFKPNFHNMCPSDAIEAIHGPASYLVALKKWSESRLPEGDANVLPLDGRRSDLNDLPIDTVTVNGSVSSVAVITHVLETFIKASIPEVESLDKALSLRRYPNGLPFHRPWVTLDYVAKQSAESVGSVMRLCDPQFPYFIRPAPWSAESDTAFLHASRLCPSQQELLTEPPYFPPDIINTEFYRENFGVVGAHGPGNLHQVDFFNGRTKLDRPGIEALLSIRGFVTTLSNNAPALDSGVSPVSGAYSGSVFINGGVSPALSIRSSVVEFLNFFEQGSHSRFDRMNRKLRLDNWLALPSHEVDALIVAAINAESNTKQAPSYWMTPNTIRALGLFQELRELHQCSAEDFAAFLWQISVFGRGTQSSQFDRIFNERTLFPHPLKIDNQAFAIIPLTEADMLTVSQLRTGLGIDLETYLYLAHVVAGAFGVTELARSLPILSSFYRLVKLPRLLGISPIEGVVLLNAVGGGNWLTALGGAPRISTDKVAQTPDALSVIHALTDCVRWCRDSELSVHWVVQQVTPIIAPSRPGEAELGLFAQLRNQLPPVLFTENALMVAGVSPLPNNRLWLGALRALVDEDGLVCHFVESADQSYETHARELIDQAVRAVSGEEDNAVILAIVEKILAVLLRSRAGQRRVVQESLAVYAQLDAERVLPVLTWSGGNAYDVLAQVLERAPIAEVATTDSNLPGDPFLGMLADFLRCSAVVLTLELSPGFLELYLKVGYDKWVGLQQAQAFDLTTLYYLTVYRRAVKLTGKPEAQLLDYLQRVNALPDNLTGDGGRLVKARAAKLLAELFAWSTQEVSACAKRANPGEDSGNGIVRSLAHLDLLTRVRAFAERSDLDAEAILAMGTLPADDTYENYEKVADRVTASLSDAQQAIRVEDVEAVTENVLTTCTVTPASLVANKPDDFATFTVTVKNRANVPQMNVNVHWASELGLFESSMTTTGENGTATVRYFGKSMGTEIASYELDLGKKQSAPPVVIGTDRSSLQFHKSQEPVEPAVETHVTLSVTLMDDYANPGIGEAVNWTLQDVGATDAEPFETQTNRQGVAEITFTRAVPAVVKVTAILGTGSTSVVFRNIKFVATS
ncbi:Tc toxin subunit A [Pseudomonas frederiksbergensis]|uniref:Tc toxin subunit A n=1 Tax=Pseudomonas frederiksbergensis TaxID=104087 RepID=UPI003D25D45E